MRAILAIPALFLTLPAAAQLRAVPDQPATAAAAQDGVDVFLLNEGPAAVAGVAPPQVDAIARDGSRLVLVPAGDVPASVAAGGFARVRYTLASSVATSPAPPLDVVALGIRPAPAREERVMQTGVGRVASFADRFMVHEPIYGAIGERSAATKLQVSLALAPFGGTGALSRFRFAYTQTMFWATDEVSGPFRATTYSPELFYDLPVGPRTIVSAGFRHDSNGEGEATSIDVNRVYVRAAQRFDLGDRWYAELVPQAWAFVGKRGMSGDMKDYWGFTALRASVGQDDGIKLSVNARGNPGTGRGAAEAFASYPLTKLGGLGIYLFGQGFTGYGEALDDYRIHSTHARIGISLTR
ncbi:phospholipase A [Sphingomonas sp. RS2018]